MIRVFIDFDGTITRRDVGDLMFETFGGARCASLVKEYLAGSLPAVECFRGECEACGEVDRASLDSFLDEQNIDESFADFLSFSRERKIECTIVSDGMDYYIARILNKHGLGNTRFIANKLDLVPVDGTERVRFRPSFPHRDENCDRCACCKRNHMLATSGENDLIYVAIPIPESKPIPTDMGVPLSF